MHFLYRCTKGWAFARRFLFATLHAQRKEFPDRDLLTSGLRRRSSMA